MKPIPEYRPLKLGQALRADDLNAQLAELVRQGKLDVTGLLALEQMAGGPMLVGVDPPTGFWAEITGRSGTRYAWREMRPAAGGTLVVVENGRSGTTSINSAYEANLSAVVATGSRVWVERGFAAVTTGGDLDQDWRFERCCGTTGTTLSGSGSGVGDDLIITPSCPDGVPVHLVGTIGSDCGCLDGTSVPLTYAGYGAVWIGTTTACSGKTVYVQVNDNGGGSWAAVVYCDGQGIAFSGPITSCSPFSLSLTGTVSSFSSCCGVGDFTVTLDVTG